MKLEVLIMGQSYLLNCPPDREAMLQAAAARVDAVMCSIRDNGKGRVRDRIAVLAALNLAFEMAQQPSIASQAIGNSDDAPVHAAQNSSATSLLSSLIDRLDAVLAQTLPLSAPLAHSSLHPDIELP